MEESTINFDISKLTLKELIEVYEKINLFIKYLEDNRLEQEGEKHE
jgi:hypothetical protein